MMDVSPEQRCHACVTYRCTGGESILIYRNSPEKTGLGKSGIVHRMNAKKKRPQTQLFVSGTEATRDLSQIVAGDKNARTVTLPNTVRKVRDRAFAGSGRLRSVVLNDGLETLGEYQGRNGGGAFSGTGLRQAELPSTLRVLGDKTFCGCEQLKHVTFAKNCAL